MQFTTNKRGDDLIPQPEVDFLFIKVSEYDEIRVQVIDGVLRLLSSSPISVLPRASNVIEVAVVGYES